jgi:PAS domain S-box-containing protein
MVSKNNIWHSLTSPNEALTSTTQRSRARLLASLVLLMLLISIILNIIYMLAAMAQVQDTYLAGTWFTLGLLIIAYALSRSRYYRAAASFTVALFSVAVFLSFISRQSYSDSDLLILLVIPVLLSSTFLSLRVAIWVTVVNVVGVILISLWHPQITTAGIIESSLTGVLYISVLVILISYHRGAMEKDRRAEMTLTEERHRAELEQRVMQRTAELARANAVLRNEIRERELAEAALRESESRYRSLIELLPNAVFLVQNDLIRLVNRAAVDMVGCLSANTLVGQPIEYFLLHKNGAATNSILMDSNGASGNRLERTLLRQDGERLVVETAATEIRYEGNDAVLAVAQDVTLLRQVEHEREHLLAQLQAANERLQHLSHHAVEVQEAERRHIARELHDEIGQSLTAIKIHLRHARNLPDLPAMVQELKSSLVVVDQLLEQVRNLSLDLRPAMLDEIGLVGTLRWYVDRQAQLTGINSHFTGELAGRLPSELELICFRMVQEALTNVARHAGAENATVSLIQRDDEIQLMVKDDGSGFDVQAARESALEGKSLGLLGMEERVQLAGGTIDISSKLGEGTVIQVNFYRNGADIEVETSPVRSLQQNTS